MLAGASKRSSTAQFPDFLELIAKFNVLYIWNQVKKTLTIFFAFLISASSIGTAVAFHYCGKSLQDVAVFGKPMPCCGGMEMPSGCCHDEKVQIKPDDFQVTKAIAATGFVPVLICQIAYPILDFNTQFEKAQLSNYFHLDRSHPPANQDIIILAHSFLI